VRLWRGPQGEISRSVPFDSSPEVIRLAVTMYVKYLLSQRSLEDWLHERGIDVCHETVRLWRNRLV
jgi:putative transposase